jgi:hypothetical protein
MKNKFYIVVLLLLLSHAGCKKEDLPGEDYTSFLVMPPSARVS